MNVKPHFVLFSRIAEHANRHDEQGGKWHFMLQSATGKVRFEASDSEPYTSTERLELLALVRGLEALEQPSRVTLITSSRKISRAMRGGLDQWRSDDWTWERFGERVRIKNHDLWQRIDGARQIHQVECRRVRLDQAHATIPCVPIDRRRPLSTHGGECSADDSRYTEGGLPRPFAYATQRVASVLQRTASWLQRLTVETQPSPRLTV